MFSTVQKSVFEDTDINIQRRCVHLLHIVQLKSKLYFAVLYFNDFCFYRQSRQIKIPAKYKHFTVQSVAVSLNIFSNLFEFALKHKATKYAFFE